MLQKNRSKWDFYQALGAHKAPNISLHNGPLAHYAAVFSAYIMGPEGPIMQDF